jgi:hypothetical protein
MTNKLGIFCHKCRRLQIKYGSETCYYCGAELQ